MLLVLAPGPATVVLRFRPENTTTALPVRARLLMVRLVEPPVPLMTPAKVPEAPVESARTRLAPLATTGFRMVAVLASIPPVMVRVLKVVLKFPSELVLPRARLPPASTTPPEEVNVFEPFR